MIRLSNSNSYFETILLINYDLRKLFYKKYIFKNKNLNILIKYIEIEKHKYKIIIIIIIIIDISISIFNHYSK